LRRERGRAVALDAEQAPQLGERVATRRLDRCERLPRTGRVGAEHLPPTGCLEHHHADVVRDHVVELACDARLLLCGRAALVLLAFALETFGLLLELAVVRAPRAQVVAEDPGRREPEHRRDRGVRPQPRGRERMRGREHEQRGDPGAEGDTPLTVRREGVRRDEDSGSERVDAGEQDREPRDDGDHEHGERPVAACGKG
jgi:hypothetical protein